MLKFKCTYLFWELHYVQHRATTSMVASLHLNWERVPCSQWMQDFMMVLTDLAVF